MSDSRPFLVTALLFAAGVIAVWRGFHALSLDRLLFGVAALALFSIVFVRTEFGLWGILVYLLAYTFMNFRRLGAMADGMRQLLVQSRDAGDRRVFTYVAEDNVPSLRGCANVGFILDHLRYDRRRLGVRRVRRVPPDAASKARWAAAVA